MLKTLDLPARATDDVSVILSEDGRTLTAGIQNFSGLSGGIDSRTVLKLELFMD